MIIRERTNKFFPEGSLRKKTAKKIYYHTLGKRRNPIGTNNLTYSEWIRQCEPELWASISKNGPLVSIVVPCYNTPARYIEPLINSVFGQTYENWQLCLADGSTDQDAKRRLGDLAQQDNRILYIDVGENLGIVGNTNKGLQIATGEYIAFLDHDDMLAPQALSEVVKVLVDDPRIDLIYSDEDKLSDNGKRRSLPFFKPDWSPDLLLGVNYITHFVVVRKSIVDEMGGLRPGFDGAQDYDFLLRLTEKTSRIKHIPKILYHWRLAEGSTAKDASQKNYADTAGQRALKDAVKRRGLLADVIEIPERPTNYRLRFQLPKKQPKVSIIIPFKDKADLLKQCVGSIIAKSTYANYELILVSNNSTEQATDDYLDSLKDNPVCRIFFWNHPFNFSKINNFGRQKAKGEYLVLLNNDTEVITPGWLEELIGVASQPGVGEVGALLHYPDKTIQHAGVVLGMTGMAGHVFRYHVPGDWTDFGLPAWPRNYLAVTAACVAIAAKKYDQVGSLDEIFTIAGNDVALGIKLHEAGYRNIYWPFAELLHYENVSVVSYQKVPKLDYDHSLDYYMPYLNWKDPYFNSNLDLMNEQIGLRRQYDQ
jgi:glycosyltransferase involved in cell wall biosynthesis